MANKSKYATYVQPKLEIIKDWARDGLLDKDIAAKCNVSLASFCEYKKKYPELLEALKTGKEEIDYKVENALLKRALGYEYEEIQEIQTSKGVKIVKVKKVVAPDPTSCIFWLKNRKPDAWREKRQEVEQTKDPNKEDIDLSSLTVDELKKIAEGGTDGKN